MSTTKISLPDKTQLEFDKKPTVYEVAQKISEGLARDAVAGFVGGEIIDMRTPLEDQTELRIITTRDSEANEIIRHSAAHVMAQAVQELWPDVKVAIGPVIEKGFYYDFDSPRPFQPEDLEKIEAKMKEIISRKDEITREEWTSEKAIEVFKKMGEEFKVELIEDLGAETVTVYRQGEWFDLCRGPHTRTTSFIKSFKLLSIAGAYWRGDENKKQLQRLYATAFYNKKDLKKHLALLEEAKKRDHRKLGKELGLYYFHQYSPGGPFFTGKGTVVYNELQGYMREMYRKYDYDEVISPQMFDMRLYEISGHAGNYQDNMYSLDVDQQKFSFKPMNCPGHCLLYQMEHHSYRDLPLRIADFGRLHRNERGGTMHGLTRVRTFCQDDAHIFCRIDQIQSEMKTFIQLLNEVYSTLGMQQPKIGFATRPEKRVGADELWDKAEAALRDGLEAMNIDYTLEEGDGAFYGPKLDFYFYDALDRPWQLGTFQCDFNLPHRFELSYIGEDNQEHRPVMLHRAILGSVERFIGVYVEHCAGRFPLWLAPVQVKILSLTDRQNEYGQSLLADLKDAGIRADFDARNEKLGFKVREAQLEKIPYMAVIGDKEMEEGTVTVRLPNGKNLQGMPKSNFIEGVKRERCERQLESVFSTDS
jgi:threonyl-tRNA synthetase